MKYEIKYKPSYSLLVVNLDKGESITGESGAMTYMDPTIEAHTRKREKSLLGSLGLTIFGGQYWDITGFPAQDYNQYNQLRYKPFHQLDLRVDKEWYLSSITINLYVDVQNVYNYKTTSNTFLVRELDGDGNPIIENPSDPADMQRYRMKELQSAAGTVLPTIGIIIEF